MDATLERIARQLDAFLRPDEDPKQARKRERILDAATGQFVAYGYRKASVDDIARASGVAKGTLYLYYRNKAELLVHAVTREKQRYLTRLAALRAPAASGRARLHGYIVLGLTLGEELPLVARLLSGDAEIAQVLAEVDADVQSRVDALRIDLTRQLIRDASAGRWSDDELARRSRVMVDLMSAVIPLLRSPPAPGRGMSAHDYATTLADIIVMGVVNDPELAAADGAAPRLRRAVDTPAKRRAG